MKVKNGKGKGKKWRRNKERRGMCHCPYNSNWDDFHGFCQTASFYFCLSTEHFIHVYLHTLWPTYFILIMVRLICVLVYDCAFLKRIGDGFSLFIATIKACWLHESCQSGTSAGLDKYSGRIYFNRDTNKSVLGLQDLRLTSMLSTKNNSC